MPEHTGQAADLALQGHRAVGAPNHEFGLLAVATFLRTARHLIPHGHAAPDPARPLHGAGERRQLPPVDEHADRRTGLAGGADFAHPDGSPQHPAQLVFLVPVKIGQGLVSAHTAVLLVGRAGFLARLCPAARIGRVGDDRVERAGLEMRDNVQRIAV